MIGSITFIPGYKGKGPRHAAPPGSWASEVETLVARKLKVEFKPGLNILFGANGSGKSTIISGVAHHMMALIHGSSAITQDTLQPLLAPISDTKSKKARRVWVDVVHDGQPVTYAAAGKLCRFTGRGMDLDYLQGFDPEGDFRTGSMGSRTLAEAEPAMTVLLGRRPPPEKVLYQKGMTRDGFNSVWVEAWDIADKLLEARIPKGQPTVLVDEPDAHLSLLTQARLWTVLGDPKVAERCQVIVATHSPFALGVPHANIIGMPEDYPDRCRATVTELARTIQSA